MNFIYLAFNIKVNLSQLIKMLNGKKMIIGIYSNIRNVLCYVIYIALSSGRFKKNIPSGYSFMCRNYMTFLIVNLRPKKTVVLPV